MSPTVLDSKSTAQPLSATSACQEDRLHGQLREILAFMFFILGPFVLALAVGFSLNE